MCFTEEAAPKTIFSLELLGSRKFNGVNLVARFAHTLPNKHNILDKITEGQVIYRTC